MRPSSRDGFHIGIICALPFEADAVESSFDETYDKFGKIYGKQDGDTNIYTTGRIDQHNIVLCFMPGMGKVSAANVATNLKTSYKRIDLALVVGICGGAPFPSQSTEILLGDVVISDSIIEYDFGRQYPDGFRRKTGVKETLGRPNQEIRSLLTGLLTRKTRREFQARICHYLRKLQIDEDTDPEWQYPGVVHDILFEASYQHKNYQRNSATECERTDCSESCNDSMYDEVSNKHCEQLGCCGRRIPRDRLNAGNVEPLLHTGTIACADTVMQSGEHRDKLIQKEHVVAFEMEGAGVWDNMPCIIIKGVSDYADSHKNKKWQSYAAATAASGAKAFLENWLPTASEMIPIITTNKHYIVPHLLSPVYTGQEQVGEALQMSLLSDAASRQIQRRFVLYGLGGSGKTQICLKYVQFHRNNYWGIFWIDASTHSSIQQSFSRIAVALYVDQDTNTVKQTLANESNHWLLIFDNADDPDLSLAPYLPTGDRGHVIITSRNPDCQHYNTVGSQEIGQMSPYDSVALLFKTIHSKTAWNDEENDEKKLGSAITRSVGYLALAIVQAAAYIRETSCSLQEYLQIYQSPRQEILEYSPRHSGTDYRYNVYTTWQVSIDKINAMQSTASKYALEMLDLLCFYHYHHVPLKMFENAWHNPRQDQAASGLPLWSTATSDLYTHQRPVQASATLLGSFSLIHRNEDATINLHPLVHEWIQQKSKAVESRHSKYRRAVSILVKSTGWNFATEDYVFRRRLVSHVHACLRCHEHTNPDFELDVRPHWPLLALVLAENGWTQEALRLTEQLLQLQKEKLGEHHPDTIQSMHSLAIRYSEAGRRDEALELSEEVVQRRKEKLGKHHPNTINSMHSLAIYYSEAGRRDEALELSEEVVQQQKEKLGEHHPDTILSMHSLAIYYSEAGRRDEALELSEEVVQRRKEKLGKHHPNTINSMHNLAISYSEAGRRDEALELSEEVMQLQKEKLGEHHPNTILSMYSLAIRYSEVGRRDEALELLKEVMQLQKEKLGENHPDTINSIQTFRFISETGSQFSSMSQQEDAMYSPRPRKRLRQAL